ncbi:hypothetical protein E2C01_064959 [Portunus trituberculatus]|uniref:Uncharacterized protein n=1 Tax=Portunus trituberculatus TaxID=210409 RepID=A0A5B7HM78_PORTR|nr:hypothetical protein [Portunus trituberculatus]
MEVRPEEFQNSVLDPFSTMPRFHIHSGSTEGCHRSIHTATSTSTSTPATPTLSHATHASPLISYSQLPPEPPFCGTLAGSLHVVIGYTQINKHVSSSSSFFCACSLISL